MTATAKPRGRPKKASTTEVKEEVQEVSSTLEKVIPEVNVVKSAADRKKEWLEEEVLVEFLNLENPGSMVEFSYGPTKNTKKYTLLHGQKHKMPRKVMHHINSRREPIYDFQPLQNPGTGQLAKQKILTGYKPRFNAREVFEDQ